MDFKFWYIHNCSCVAECNGGQLCVPHGRVSTLAAMLLLVCSATYLLNCFLLIQSGDVFMHQPNSKQSDASVWHMKIDNTSVYFHIPSNIVQSLSVVHALMLQVAACDVSLLPANYRMLACKCSHCFTCLYYEHASSLGYCLHSWVHINVTDCVKISSYHFITTACSSN